nr:hypothetical protein CFP56_71457 [Quercus suber]
MAGFLFTEHYGIPQYPPPGSIQSPANHARYVYCQDGLGYTETTTPFSSLSSLSSTLFSRLFRRPESIDLGSVLDMFDENGSQFYSQDVPRQGSSARFQVYVEDSEDMDLEYVIESFERPVGHRQRARHRPSTSYDNDPSRRRPRGHGHVPIEQVTAATELNWHDADIQMFPWVQEHAPRLASLGDKSSPPEEDASASRQSCSRLRHQWSRDERDVQRLSHAVEQCCARIRSIQRYLDRAASTSTTSRDYHQLLNELRSHERSRKEAIRDLEHAQQKLDHTRDCYNELKARVRRTRSHHAHPEHVPRPSQGTNAGGMFSSIPSFFADRILPSREFDEPSRRSRRRHEDIHENSVRGPPHAEKHPWPQDHSPRTERRSRPRRRRADHHEETSHSKHEPEQHRARTTRPPATSLQPEEAKVLFRQYNDQWHSRTPSDSHIPFPTRGLHASALPDHRTLWSPHTFNEPCTWSKDTTMQANAQAFFLHAVGLTPRYTVEPESGRIHCGLDTTRVRSSMQIRELLELLKKEKVRWHPDRIGRRNDGAPGVNEELQRDERVRAVFYAVCELMEVAQAGERKQCNPGLGPQSVVKSSHQHSPRVSRSIDPAVKVIAPARLLSAAIKLGVCFDVSRHGRCTSSENVCLLLHESGLEQTCCGDKTRDPGRSAHKHHSRPSRHSEDLVPSSSFGEVHEKEKWFSTASIPRSRETRGPDPSVPSPLLRLRLP